LPFLPTTRRKLSASQLPLAWRPIALLSDFHYDPYFSVHPLRASITMVNGLHPELIVLTGDFVSVPFFGDNAKGAFDSEPCA
jgi:predicted MPP superfamily phosphohydrolase